MLMKTWIKKRHEAHLHGRCELWHNVVVVGVKPFGHLHGRHNSVAASHGEVGVEVHGTSDSPVVTGGDSSHHGRCVEHLRQMKRGRVSRVVKCIEDTAEIIHTRSVVTPATRRYQKFDVRT